ncbi:MAG: hypothetical protein ABIA76_04620 [Candidatus Diapherotrites archaeon]
MVYEHTNSKGKKYYLNKKEMRNGTLYYFSKEKKATGCDLPSDRKVIESEKTGLPMLKKK